MAAESGYAGGSRLAVTPEVWESEEEGEEEGRGAGPGQHSLYPPGAKRQ